MAVSTGKYRKKVVNMRMLKLEIRRILKTKLTIILLIAALGLTFIMAYLPVTYVKTSYMDTEGNAVEVSGKEAIAYDKLVQKDIGGEITDSDFENAVRHYQECLSSYGVTKTNELPNGVYEKEIYPYEPLYRSIMYGFADPVTGNVPTIMDIPVEKAGNFYAECEKNLETLMKLEQKDNPKAQQDALERYEHVEKPYKFYSGYNKDALDYQILLSFVIMTLCVVIAAPVFSSDYQTEADAILRCTKYGRSKLAITKIVSGLLISSVVYAICIGLYLIISNSMFGWECTGTSVQMLYSVINFVNMNLGELQLCVAAAGLLTVLATVSLTLFLSSRFKNVVVSLGISLMICILPIVFYIALPNDVATWVNAFIPSSGVGLVTSILYSLVDFVYLSVGKISVWLPYVMVGIGIIEIPVFVLGAIGSYMEYKRR